MENKIKISVSMIVKNEEAMLARCLESVKSADEIVIVDTGSTDGTLEIAHKFTEKVLSFHWIDDFSAARNFAKDHCSGDFVLSIDADEYLEEGGMDKIRALLASAPRYAVGIKMTSTNNQYHTPRLFKKDKDIFFEGPIHESLNVSDFEKTDIVITFEDSPTHASDPDRNLRILRKANAADMFNTRYLFYLGREYGYRSDWRSAIATLEEYLKLGTWLQERADAYFMLGVCYWNISEGEKARVSVLMALNINANFKAAILLMADMSFENNARQWKKMAETATNEGVLFSRENFRII